MRLSAIIIGCFDGSPSFLLRGRGRQNLDELIDFAFDLTDLEIAAVTDRVSKNTSGGPALLFEQPAGYSMPVASNVFGSLERMSECK